MTLSSNRIIGSDEWRFRCRYRWRSIAAAKEGSIAYSFGFDRHRQMGEVPRGRSGSIGEIPPSEGQVERRLETRGETKRYDPFVYGLMSSTVIWALLATFFSLTATPPSSAINGCSTGSRRPGNPPATMSCLLEDRFPRSLVFRTSGCRPQHGWPDGQACSVRIGSAGAEYAGRHAAEASVGLGNQDSRCSPLDTRSLCCRTWPG
jgi:hypothetical protein